MLEFEQARADAQMAAVGRMGSLRVGYSSIASRTVLPGAVAAIEAESSRVHVHLQQLKSGPQLTALRAGELDIALTSGRPLASELSARELHTLQVQVVVTAADPLARRKAVRFVDLRNRRCILFERAQSPMMYDAIAGGATHAGVDLNVAEFVSDGWHANAMVLGRSMVGFATGLGMAADAGRAPGGRQLVNIPLIEPTPRLALHAIWRSSGETSLLMRFVDALATAGAQVRLPTESG
ncbi:LysR family substrate-binding domain-containing protein [Nocardia arizonensis]|uniref:LysR family substrate-binding domain-containing protein n=1 Tax=Nocardia arizonensis TaxID=1141647 RepID=UPI001EF5C004|nr:LysR family substrate-binding domain-containing protein [Nocardia arizonensis]